MRKKLISLALVCAMVFALGATALADDTTVSYNAAPKYTVTIPAAVTLKDSGTTDAEIKAEDVLLEADKKIVVTLTGASNTTGGNTFNAKNGTSVATYTISKDETQIALNDTVAEFTANGTQELTFSKADNSSVTVAGDHTETLTFTIAVVAPVAVTGVTLDKTSLELAAGGDTTTLTATVAPTDATDKTVTWSSSDDNVATVDENGVVTSVAVGTATITATAGGETATCTVKVIVPVTGVTLDKANLTLQSNTPVTLNATVAPDNATNKTVTWSSSDTSVATVDNTGKVTAVANGSTTITASCGGYSATCDVTVNATLATAFENGKTTTVRFSSFMGEAYVTFTKGNGTYSITNRSSSNVKSVAEDGNRIVITFGFSDMTYYDKQIYLDKSTNTYTFGGDSNYLGGDSNYLKIETISSIVVDGVEIISSVTKG